MYQVRIRALRRLVLIRASGNCPGHADKQPSVHPAGSNQYETVADHPKVCARIAQGQHRLVPDISGAGTFKTGNCIPLKRI